MWYIYLILAGLAGLVVYSNLETWTARVIWALLAGVPVFVAPEGYGWISLAVTILVLGSWQSFKNNREDRMAREAKRLKEQENEP